MRFWEGKIKNEIREKRILKSIEIYEEDKLLVIKMNFIDNSSEESKATRIPAFHLGEILTIEPGQVIQVPEYLA